MFSTIRTVRVLPQNFATKQWGTRTAQNMSFIKYRLSVQVGLTNCIAFTLIPMMLVLEVHKPTLYAEWNLFQMYTSL